MRSYAHTHTHTWHRRFRQWLLQQDPTQIDMRVAMASLLSTASASHVGKLSELLRKDVSFKSKKNEGSPVDLLRARIRDFVRRVPGHPMALSQVPCCVHTD